MGTHDTPTCVQRHFLVIWETKSIRSRAAFTQRLYTSTCQILDLDSHAVKKHQCPTHYDSVWLAISCSYFPLSLELLVRYVVSEYDLMTETYW